MAKGLTLVRSDYDITKKMIETGEVFEDFSYVETINRLFRWYYGEEGLDFDNAVKAIENWLSENVFCHTQETVKEIEDWLKDENGVYYSHNTIVDKCKWCLDKKGKIKEKLVKLHKVKIYENEVEMINGLPNADIKRAYFTMMVYCKLRQQQKLKPWNKLFNTYNEFLSYAGGQISAKAEIESLNWLYQNGYVDVPLDDLSCYYYTGVEGSGKEVYEIDGTKLGKKDFREIYIELFGRPTKEEEIYKILVIDLMQVMQESEQRVLKNDVAQVIDYLKEQGVKATNTNIHKILKHTKYAVANYTFVKIPDGLEKVDEYLRGAEILQRSLFSCSKVAFKAIPPHIMSSIFEKAEEFKDKDIDEIQWCVYKKNNKRGLVSKLRH